MHYRFRNEFAKMIIDTHVHIGRNDHIKTDIKQLLASMDTANIDKALVFAGKINDCPNDYLLEQVAPHKDRLYAVAFGSNEMSPSDIKKLVDMYLNKQIVAVKFYTGYEHYYPSDYGLRSVLHQLAQVKCPVIFHSGDCLNSVKSAKLKFAHPIHIDEVAVDYPNLPIIIAHLGFPWIRDTAEVCYKNSNVYTDISGFVYGKFTGFDQPKFKKTIIEFLEIAPSSKLLFGTDFPISDQTSYLSSLDDAFGEALTAQTLTKNAIKAFGLQ